MSFEWEKKSELWPRLDKDAVLVIYLSYISNPKTQSVALSILDEEEKKRAQVFHFEKDRICFANVRAALKILISQLNSIRSSDISIIYNKYSKPILLGENSLRFNVSHSFDSALVAFSLTKDVGVDLECLAADRNIDSIAKKHFSAEECSFIFEAEAHERVQRFFQLWTAKEAFLKAKGKGLWADLTEARFPLQEFIQTKKTQSEGYQLISLELPNPDYKGALCIKGGWEVLHCYEMSVDQIF